MSKKNAKKKTKKQTDAQVNRELKVELIGLVKQYKSMMGSFNEMLSMCKPLLQQTIEQLKAKQN